MATSITFNGTTYSIPAEGELAWASLSSFLVDVGNNAAVSEEFKQAIRVATTSPVTVSSATDAAVVTDLSVAGAVTVNLPAGTNKQIFVIVDGKGDATTNNITINRNGSDTIAGQTSLVLNHNRQAVMLQYHAATTDWKILVNSLYPGTINLTSDVTGILPVANGGTGISSLGAGVATFLGTPSSANLAAALTDETGTGAAVFANSPTLVTPALGTPSSVNLTNATDLPVATGISGLGANVATFLATPSSANLAAALTDETGTGAAVFANSPTLVTPALGTPSSGVATNLTGLPLTTGTTGVLPETKGGTNQSTYTTGDLLYASASNTLSKLAAGTSGQVLTQGASVPSWADASAGGSGEINCISNPSAASATTGWSDDANHSKTRLTSGSPLDPVTTTAFRFTKDNTNVSTETSTSGVYFPFTLPVGLENKKLKAEFYCIIPATGTWKVSVYDGTTRLALSTDSSGATTLPAGFTGKFTTYFDTTANNSYTISFTETAGVATNLDVTGIIVGPGIQPQGAVVGEWLSFTPTGGWSGGNVTYTGKYRRVGDSLECSVKVALAGTPVGSVLTINTPFTIDTSKMSNTVQGRSQVGFGDLLDSGTAAYALSVNYYTTTSVVVNYEDDGANGILTGNVNSSTNAPITFASGDTVTIWFTVPIAEWAGSGTVAQNDVEYSYNSSATTADDTTSFAYGPSGVAFQSFAPAGTAFIKKTVRFLTPIQSTDVVTIEVSQDSGVTWSPIPENPFSFESNDAGTTLYGAYGAAVNSTDYDVRFHSKANKPQAWSTYTGGSFKWRCKKSKSGQAVGFGEVGQNTSGLVKSAGQLKGTNTNDNAATGYVGEHFIQSRTILDKTPLTSGVKVNVTASNITLTAGDWLIGGSVSFDSAVTTTFTILDAAISKTSATLPSTSTISVPTAGEYWNESRPETGAAGGVQQTLTIPPYRVSLSSSTNFYLVGGATFAVSTADIYGSFWAWRVR